MPTSANRSDRSATGVPAVSGPRQRPVREPRGGRAIAIAARPELGAEGRAGDHGAARRLRFVVGERGPEGLVGEVDHDLSGEVSSRDADPSRRGDVDDRARCRERSAARGGGGAEWRHGLPQARTDVLSEMEGPSFAAIASSTRPSSDRRSPSWPPSPPRADCTEPPDGPSPPMAAALGRPVPQPLCHHENRTRSSCGCRKVRPAGAGARISSLPSRAAGDDSTARRNEGRGNRRGVGRT